MSLISRFISREVTEEAEGCIDAQNVLCAIDSGHISIDYAWLRFVELAAKHHWKSAACRAFVRELAKRRGARE